MLSVSIQSLYKNDPQFSSWMIFFQTADKFEKFHHQCGKNFMIVFEEIQRLILHFLFYRVDLLSNILTWKEISECISWILHNVLVVTTLPLTMFNEFTMPFIYLFTVYLSMNTAKCFVLSSEIFHVRIAKKLRLINQTVYNVARGFENPTCSCIMVNRVRSFLILLSPCSKLYLWPSKFITHI